MESAFLGRWFQIMCFRVMKMFCDFVTQYCELYDETTCNGKSVNAAFRCVKNQLLPRSGWLCGDKSVFAYFGKIVVANPKKIEFRKFQVPSVNRTIFSSSFEWRNKKWGSPCVLGVKLHRRKKGTRRHTDGHSRAGDVVKAPFGRNH